MIVYKTTIDDIRKAYKKINKIYEYNLLIDLPKDYEEYTNGIIRYKFNLYTDDKNKKGSRININNNKNKYACIHAHYDFFNILLEINPNATICVCGDWIIKKDKNNKIIGNLLKFDKYSIHKIKPSSFICQCNKWKG
jgi:hypothetical protein